MTEEHSRYLIETFPFLNNSFFENRFAKYGMECGDGWFDLIKDLFENLLALNIPDLEIWVVKEKCGELSINVGVVNSDAIRLIREAEKKSVTICELCGKAGMLKKNKMISQTRCDKCRKAPAGAFEFLWIGAIFHINLKYKFEQNITEY